MEGRKYLIKGDINGIQRFIFKVSQGHGGVAKTLRARSFFIKMFGDSVAAYLLGELGQDNARAKLWFSGGGQFLLEVQTEEPPEKIENVVSKVKREVQKYCLERLEGELAFSIAVSEGLDFERLQVNLIEEKSKKFSEILQEFDSEEPFILTKREVKENVTLCPVCRTFFYEDDPGADRCFFCYLFQAVGRKIATLGESKVYFDLGDGGYYLKPKQGDDEGSVVFSLFKPSLKTASKIELGDFFLAVPILARDLTGEEKERYDLKEEEDLKKGDIAPFEVIAAESKGDKKLGYLKMDVDNLGLLFYQIGRLSGEKRIAIQQRISNTVKEFFSQKVADIARSKFKPEEDSVLTGTLIYLLYSGGDDLFAIGPWDKLIEFAIEIRDSFKKVNKEVEEFLAKEAKKILSQLKKRENGKENRDILSLSAGFFLAKPKFTIDVAAKMCESAEEEAKKAKDKDSINVFGETLKWEELKVAKEAADKLLKELENGNIARRFFYRLLLLNKRYLKNGELKGGRLMFYPYLYYYLKRTVDESLHNDILRLVELKSAEDEGVANLSKRISFICRYILTASRGMKDDKK